MLILTKYPASVKLDSNHKINFDFFKSLKSFLNTGPFIVIFVELEHNRGDNYCHLISWKRVFEVTQRDQRLNRPQN